MLDNNRFTFSGMRCGSLQCIWCVTDKHCVCREGANVLFTVAPWQDLSYQRISILEEMKEKLFFFFLIFLKHYNQRAEEVTGSISDGESTHSYHRNTFDKANAHVKANM